MKKIMAILLMLTLTVGLFACGEANAPESTEAPAATQSTDTDDTEITGYYCEIGGKKFAPGGSVDTFLADLESVGVTFNSKEEAMSCVFAQNGNDITYHFDFGDVFTFPPVKDQPNVVDEIDIFDSSVLICGKVRVGDTFETLKAQLGEEFFVDEGDVVYNAENDPNKKKQIPKMVFYFDGETISGCSIVANLYQD